MTAHEFRREVPAEELDAFLYQVIPDTKEETLKRIMRRGLLRLCASA